MRLCQVVDYYELGQGGGPFPYCRHLAARGHDVTLLAPTRIGAPDDAVRDGVACAFLPYPPRDSALRFLWSSWTGLEDRFRALDRQAPFDAVVLHHPITAFQLLSRGLLRDRPAVYFFNSPWSVEWFLNARAARPDLSESSLPARLHMETRRRIEEHNLRSARAVVSQSEFTRSQLFLHHPAFPPSRTRVIPGGVDPDRFRPAADRASVRAALGLPREGTILFTLRRLVPRMGLFNLLSAFQRVLARRPDAHLVIGGAGPLRESLETAARDMGLAGPVRFLGYVPEPDVPRLFQAADLFVLPSSELEGFGYVTIEALASGLPVVATPVGGSREVLGGFDAGCLTRGTDAEALAERMVEMLDDPQRMSAAYRARCRDHAVARYAWPEIAARVERVLSEAARTEGRRTPAARPRGTAARVREANRAVYNAKRLEDYERNESIFADARQETVERMLASLAREAGPRGRVLDIGCGSGNVARLARAWFRWAGGVDIGWRLLGQARRRSPLPLVGGETERLPFRDGAVDCVTAYAVLHHLLDPRPTFREAYRILRPGGVFYTDHDVNHYFARFYQPVYRLAHLRRPGFAGPDEDYAEYHNTKTSGLDPEALAASLRRIGFREARVEYWHTQNPSLPLPRRIALRLVKALAALTGARSFFTHFRIVARK
jgi:glycosyltransferase involved in cell wall biosynthesis/ubiquinone/menaquinone biosynthesis C-methylase UbiE